MSGLWAHQTRAIELAKDLPHYALFMEQGCGKTRTTIEILRGKFNEAKRILRTLILCPPIVVPNWRDEWLKYSKIDPWRVVLLTGSGRKRFDTFQKNAWDGEQSPQGRIFVTNYEALLMEDLFSAFRVWLPEVLVNDESHKCKDIKAKRTKLAIQLASTARHKYILSGTPVLNSPMDIFSQFHILDNGETFGKNFFAFRARYFRDRNAGMPKARYFPDWQLIPGALDEINQLIFKKGMRVEKKDCLDLPPLVRQTIKVGMTPEQAKAYQEMKRDMVALLNDKAVIATLAITRALRLMQIASGFAKTVDGEEIGITNTPKMEALKELLGELAPHHKVLVWACFKQNYKQIRKVCEELGIKYVEAHGEVSAKQKTDNVKIFSSDDSVRVWLGHPASSGLGVNLVAASYSIFYSRSFSLEHDLQAEARNHRGGCEQHPKITRIDLVTEGTIEEAVLKSLAAKQEISVEVLRNCLARE